ncbi:hypothetical protein V8C42DRAFT_318932 [Trichoderma barbatum]
MKFDNVILYGATLFAALASALPAPVVTETKKNDVNAAEPYRPSYFSIIKKDTVESDAIEPYKPSYFSIIKKHSVEADASEPYRPSYFTIIKKEAQLQK